MLNVDHGGLRCGRGGHREEEGCREREQGDERVGPGAGETTGLRKRSDIQLKLIKLGEGSTRAAAFADEKRRGAARLPELRNV